MSIIALAANYEKGNAQFSIDHFKRAQSNGNTIHM